MTQGAAAIRDWSTDALQISAFLLLQICLILKLRNIRQLYWFKINSSAWTVRNTIFGVLLILDPFEKLDSSV